MSARILEANRRVGEFGIRPGWNVAALDLAPGGGFRRDCAVELSSGWVPAERGISDDVRELGIMVAAIETPRAVPGRGWLRASARAVRGLLGPREQRPAGGSLRRRLEDAEAEIARLRDLVEPPFDAGRYDSLERRLRGSRELVRERQSPYAELFAGRRSVLDVGCGRGEFLEALAQAGGEGSGVDANPLSVEDCRQRGLRVVLGDALEYLAGLPEASLDGIFCAQLVEHLTPDRRFELLRLAQRALEPGGLVVVETPNPECLSVGACSFWLDPTHRAPIPPDLLGFELEQAGLEILELRRTSPGEEEERLPSAPGMETWRDRLNDLLFGARDYAFVCRHPGGPPRLA